MGGLKCSSSKENGQLFWGEENVKRPWGDMWSKEGSHTFDFSGKSESLRKMKSSAKRTGIKKFSSSKGEKVDRQKITLHKLNLLVGHLGNHCQAEKKS